MSSDRRATLAAVELAVVVCVILAFVVLAQIRHWHRRAVAAWREEERRRVVRADVRREWERAEWAADDGERAA